MTTFTEWQTDLDSEPEIPPDERAARARAAVGGFREQTTWLHQLMDDTDVDATVVSAGPVLADDRPFDP